MGVHIVAAARAGPWWLSVPLGCLLLATLCLALRGRSEAADPVAAAGFTATGFLLLVASLLAHAIDRSPALAELLLYGAAQAWIFSFWALRGRGGSDDDGGEPRDEGGGGPPWWPEFERDFRDYARRSPPPGAPRPPERLRG